MRLVCVKAKGSGKKSAEVKRIPVDEAEALVTKGWSYASKKEWRQYKNALHS